VIREEEKAVSELQHANNFRDLIVYQKARQASRLVFELSKGFPREEMYSMTDQIRRASRSVGAQIAEAWGKRRYARAFVNKLTDADAEQLETQHWIESAAECGYVTGEQRDRVVALLSEVGRMLGSMLAKADQFCGDGSQE
jgi:four helix bundle protein